MQISQKLFFGGALAICVGLSGPVTASDNPLSAIPWLSDVTQTDLGSDATTKRNDIAQSAKATQITTTPLGQIRLDEVGLIPYGQVGLSKEFWLGSSTDDLASRISKLPHDLPPPLLQFLTTLLLTEIPAPADSKDGAAFFLTRIDKFIELGALDQAHALLLRAGPTRPELYRRWFDVSLLRREEDLACKPMLDTPSIAPTYAARIFCLSRDGQWDAAVVTLGTGEILGLVSEQEADLLARFLDPELFEGEPPLTPPQQISPLAFRIYEAIGDPLPVVTLPAAFAYSDLTEQSGWKAQLVAAERLTRHGGLQAQQLFAFYTARKPAASGGVWDRARAVQDFEQALAEGDQETLARSLQTAMNVLRPVGLDYWFDQHYGRALSTRAGLGHHAWRAALMAGAYDKVNNGPYADDIPSFLRGITAEKTSELNPSSALEAAVLSGLQNAPDISYFQPYLAERRFGEAALEAMALLADGARSDPIDIERGLALFHHLNLSQLARQMAVYLLLSEPDA